MLLTTALLSGYLFMQTAVPQAEPVNMPEACFVFGEIFWSPYQVNAMLSSNCPISIERKDLQLILRSRNGIVEIDIPEQAGLHEFIYRWGRQTAHFDDDTVPISRIVGR